MSKRRLKIASYKSDIEDLNKEKKILMEKMKEPLLSVGDFRKLSEEYNRIFSKIYVLKKKINNLENYKHELGDGNEFGISKDTI